MSGPWEKYAAASSAAPAAEAAGPWAKYGGSTTAPEAMPTPVEEMGAIERLRAGIGMGMAKAGRGIKQALDAGAAGLESIVPGGEALSRMTGGKTAAQIQQETNSDIAEARRIDAPLADTTAGKVGNAIGGAAVAAPGMLIPGANTYIGAGLVGAGTGALSTEGGISDRAAAAGAGALGGVLGKGAGDAIGAGARAFAARSAANKTAAAGRQAAATAARDAGYVLPPTEFNPGPVNSLLEGLSGKIKTAQSASTKNQKVTNTLAARSVGADETAPLTKEALAAVRSEAGKVYDQLSKAGEFVADAPFAARLQSMQAPIQAFEKQFPQLANREVAGVFEALNQPRFDSAATVEALKRLRFEGNANKVSMDPAKKELGRIQTEAAKALEDLVDRNLSAGGSAELLKQFKEARQLIAKSHTVEKALNDTTGDVSAKTLAGMLQKGKPLSGDLKTIAEVGNAFPKATQTLPQSYNAISPLDYATAAIGSGATGNPMLLAGIAARPAIRAGLLSSPYQAVAQRGMTATPLRDLLISAGQRPAIQQGVRLGTLGTSLEAAKK